MNFRSVADLDRTIRVNLRRLPPDIDAVIGIPRSGMLCASLIALHRNLPLASLSDCLEDRPFEWGGTRALASWPQMPSTARHVLIADDSLRTGVEMERVRDRLRSASSFPGRMTFVAAYGPRLVQDGVTILEVVEEPRVFGWNVMHHVHLDKTCIDLDSILFAREISADRPLTADWLRVLSPSVRPTRRVHSVLTSLFERDRAIVERWLADAGITYRFLVMRSDGVRESDMQFKADYYSRSQTHLFIEGKDEQAQRLAAAAGKPVLAFDSQKLVLPSGSLASGPP